MVLNESNFAIDKITYRFLKNDDNVHVKINSDETKKILQRNSKLFAENSLNKDDFIDDLLQTLLKELADSIYNTLTKIMTDIKGAQADTIGKINEQKEQLPKLIGNVTNVITDAKTLINNVTGLNLDAKQCDTNVVISAKNLLNALQNGADNCLNKLIKHINEIVLPIETNIKHLEESGSKLLQDGLECVSNLLACGFRMDGIVKSISSTLDIIGDLVKNVGKTESKLFFEIPFDIAQCFSPNDAVDILGKLIGLIACLKSLMMK